jgi:hypothetical protein
MNQTIKPPSTGRPLLDHENWATRQYVAAAARSLMK